MDYRPNYYSNRNAIDKSNRYKKKRIFWLNSSFNSDFVLIDNKIYEISWDIPPFEIFQNNRLKLLTYIRDSNQSKPIQIKLKLPLTQSRDIINTDKETFPIIYTNHTGVEMMTSGSNPIIRLIPQQITRFTFRVDDNFNNYYNTVISSLTGGQSIIQNNRSYNSIIFKNSGTFILDVSIKANILLVGGGAQGGCTDGGGGGAGGLVFIPNYTFLPGTYNITIGAGGQDVGGSADVATGSPGGDTIITRNNLSFLIAKGGGGGGTRYPPGVNAAAGGSGGGAGGGSSASGVGGAATQTDSAIVSGDSLTYGKGNKGGDNTINSTGGAGGGGAGQAGNNTTGTNAFLGGNGLASVIIDGITYNFKNVFNLTTDTNSINYVGKVESDTNIYFAGGGGGGLTGTNRIGGLGGGGTGFHVGNGGAATLTNTGSGGGGGGGGFGQGGRGSDGVVIISYTINPNQRNEGITAEENLIQATNNTITVNTDSKYVINYQNPIDIPKGTYETIFATGGITFKSKPDYTYTVLNTNPIVWYKFDNNNLTKDETNIYNSTNFGATYDDNKIIKGSGSAKFNRSLSQYISLPYLPINNWFSTTGISFSIWINIENLDSSFYSRVFSFHAVSPTNNSHYISLIFGPTSNPKLYFEANNSTGNFMFGHTLINPVSSNTWYHCILTLKYISASSTEIKSYLNGNLITTETVNSTIANYTTSIVNNFISRGAGAGIGERISGNVDDFRIYNKILEINEVYDLYNGNTDRSYPILKDANNATINPTAWYKFDNNNLTTDSSGNGYNLTNNGVVLNNSIFVKGDASAYFNPSNTSDFKYLTYSGIDFGSKSFSISIWVYLSENTAGVQYWILSTNRIDSTNRTLIIGFEANNKMRFAFYGNDLDYVYTLSNDINKWVHWCFTYDSVVASGNNRFIYRNGVQVAADRSSSSLSSPSTILEIGRWNLSANTLFYGYLDDLRIYHGIAFTATQVSELYNGRISIYNPPAFLTGFELEDEDLIKENTISSYK